MAKNIVLLSDGTGNSSAQLMKTNVWRVYESLDLRDPSKQVACYDDGVGTSTFKPLAVAGGAFGVGLRRNVLRLYRFLCEHYDDGDQIFLFGFSRGAFTVRVLANFIADQGIIKTRPTLPSGPDAAAQMPAHEAAAHHAAVAVAAPGTFVHGSELARLTSWAYREFRKQFRMPWSLVPPARMARDVVFRAWDSIRKRQAYDPSFNHQDVPIAFIGVWDTVDAYGLAVDELTDGVDRWVWPLSMPDLKLRSNVKRACHALALDDERNTFHPVLWDESSEPQNARNIDDERISQVWFAGMHSNVGGGYADDALSALSLKWMTDRVAGHLRFIPEVLAHHTEKRDPMGRVYDSRSGVKSYYRYNPRRIEWLTNGLDHERRLFANKWPKPQVKIARPKIHESVFTRMSAAPEAYAPIGIPRNYAVVLDHTGDIVEGASNPYETPAAAAKREDAEEAVWDLVWRRRLFYFATVAATLYLVLYLPFSSGAEEAIRHPQNAIAGEIVGFAAKWAPGASYAGPWLAYYQARPWDLIVGVVVVLLLSFSGTSLQGRICHTMRGIWLKVLPPAINRHHLLNDRKGTLTAIRTSDVYQGLFALWRRAILPNVVGIVLLWVLIAAGNRALFESVNGSGLLCTAKPDGAPAAPELTPGQFCQGTGVQLEANSRYRVTVDILPAEGTTAKWQDGDVNVTYTPAGFTAGSAGMTRLQRAIFVLATPFKRLLSADWYVPVARIGASGLDQYALDKNELVITPKTSGELFLFVNDAIAPLGPCGIGWRSYYCNNYGRARITVAAIPQ